MRKYGISKYKEACEFFENYAENKSNYIFIHYARQNCFDESYAKGPRVIATAVMEANDAQMRLFSLKKTSEELDIDFFQQIIMIKTTLRSVCWKNFLLMRKYTRIVCGFIGI